MPNTLTELMKTGQSIWFDNIRRAMLKCGDLARMIEQDELGGAGLDVFEHEPAVNPKLVRLARANKVVLLPHHELGHHRGPRRHRQQGHRQHPDLHGWPSTARPRAAVDAVILPVLPCFWRTSLNPILSIGFQISETISQHLHMSRTETRNRVLDLLKMVEIPNSEKRLKEYAHQLSGGMRQRVMIAMAIACNPKVIIADEPTTALDVTIQAQILGLLKQIQKELGTSIILITHNLGIIAEMPQDVAVMYAGKIVEKSETVNIFNNPLHAYTRGLLLSIPKIIEGDSRGRLRESM